MIFFTTPKVSFGEGNGNPLQYSCPWREEPGRLQSMGWLPVRHDWVTSLSLFTFTHWRRKWQPTPVFLPGESQGRGGLVGCHLWGHRVGQDWSDLAAAAAAAKVSFFWLLASILPDWNIWSWSYSFYFISNHFIRNFVLKV